MSKNYIFETSRKNIMRVTAWNEENSNNSPCIIIVHGFKGFKDWGFFPYSADYLSRQGYFVLTFNFSHNGVGENLLEFREPDKFALNTYSLEVEELKELIDAYKNGFFGKVNNQKTGILGHSRGGGISLLTASKRTDIDAVAAWSSISTVSRYTEQQVEKWRKEGSMSVQNARTKQVMHMNVSVLEDIEQNSEDSLNIEKAVKNLQCPLFIAHGEQDLSVKISEAEDIYSWSDKSKSELLKIPATGHTFDVVHPFEGSNPKLEFLLSNTVNFFNKYLI